MVKKVYLDTHVIAWLYSGKIGKFSPKTQKILNESSLFYSPIVKLELDFLNEIGRIKKNATDVLSYLSQAIDLEECKHPFSAVINESLRFGFTRDPFDRIIVAQASCEKSTLVTHDQLILKNYKYCIS